MKALKIIFIKIWKVKKYFFIIFFIYFVAHEVYYGIKAEEVFDFTCPISHLDDEMWLVRYEQAHATSTHATSMIAYNKLVEEYGCQLPTFGYKCPAEFKTSEEYEASLAKWIKDYHKEYPWADRKEMMDSRQELFIKNKCAPSQHYIEGSSVFGKLGEEVTVYGTPSKISLTGDFRFIRTEKNGKRMGDNYRFYATYSILKEEEIDPTAEILWENPQDVYKITGIIENDDCEYYYDDGFCIPSLSLIKIVKAIHKEKIQRTKLEIQEEQSDMKKIYTNPEVKHLRFAFNSYLTGSNSGIDDDFVIKGTPETEDWCGLGKFNKSYYKSKFVVWDIEPNEVSGLDLFIVFLDKPDTLFWTWVRPDKEAGKYLLSAFCKTPPNKNRELEFPGYFKWMLKNKMLNYSI